MADAVARFHLSLSEDMAGASAAAGNLDAMKVAIQNDIKELNALKLAMKDMSRAGKGSGDVFDAMKAQAKSLEVRIAGNQEKFAKLGGSFAPSVGGLAKVAKGAAESGATIEEMTAMAKGALGPMGGIFEKATLISKGLGAGGMAGIILAVTLATIAFAAAVWGGVFALAKFAVEANKDAMAKLSKATDAAKSNIDKLFSGIKVDKFVKAYEEVLQIFEESTASAKAIKTLLGTLLNPLFDATTGIAPIVKVAMKGIVAGFLVSAIAVLYLRNAIRDVIPSDLISNISMLKIVFWTVVVATVALTLSALVLAAAGTVLAVVLGAVVLVAIVALATTLVGVVAVMSIFVAAIALVVAICAVFLAAVIAVGTAITAVLVTAVLLAVAVIMLPFILPIAAILLLKYYLEDVGAAFGQLGSMVSSAASSIWSSLMSALSGLGGIAADAAASIISGLIGGITSGAGALYSAMTGLASGAMNAFKSAIGYGSPAKAFIAYGQIGIAGGVEKGVDQGAPSVNSAVDGMVSIPGASTNAAKLSGGGGKVVVQFIYQGKDKAEEKQARGLLSQICETIENGCKQAGIPLELETV